MQYLYDFLQHLFELSLQGIIIRAIVFLVAMDILRGTAVVLVGVAALTLMLTVSSLLITTQHDTFFVVPAMFIAGLLSDLILWRLKPSAAAPGRLLRLVRIPVSWIMAPAPIRRPGAHPR